MASQEITIDTSILKGDISKLKSLLSTMRNAMNDMFGQITELDSMWDGPANDEFNKQFAVDFENTKNLCDTVESLIGCMEYAGDQYDHCESEVGNIVNSIRI